MTTNRRSPSPISILFLLIGLLCFPTTGPCAESPAQTLEKLVTKGSIQDIQAYLGTRVAGINDRPLRERNSISEDWSLLDYAAAYNKVEIAAFLIAQGADIHAIQQHGLNQGISALHIAAATNSAGVVELLLTHGLEANTRNTRNPAPWTGATPLFFGAANGSRQAVELLLQHGADPSLGVWSGRTPVSEAIAHGYIDIVKLLVAHGAQLTTSEGPGTARNALLNSALEGTLDGVKFSLTLGVNTQDMGDALKNAVFRADRQSERKQIIDMLLAQGAITTIPGLLQGASTPDLFEYLVQHGIDSKVQVQDGNLVMNIVYNYPSAGALKSLRLLYERGVDLAASPDKSNRALWWAVEDNESELTEFLLTHGFTVDSSAPNLPSPIFQTSDPDIAGLLLRHGANLDGVDERGISPLSAAIADGRWRVAESLLSRGASLSSRGPLLNTAAAAGQFEFMKALLARGADINERDGSGNSALHVAIEHDQDTVVEFLIKQGADINAPGYHGSTPLHIAAERNNPVLVTWLLEKHANTTARDAEGVTPVLRASSSDVRALFYRYGAAADPDPVTAKDLAACHQVPTNAQFWSSNDDGTDVQAAADHPRDPGDGWDYLQFRSEREVAFNGGSYILGFDLGPVYLARIGTDGVERVLCEYAPQTDRKPLHYRILNEYERLQMHARTSGNSISVESLKRADLSGPRALLEASRRKMKPIPLGENSQGNVLGDAIEAHRDDVLRFYLEHGVSANLATVDKDLSPDDRPRHDSPLLIAVRSGTQQTVQLLLDHGANPDASGQNQESSVTAAARLGKISVLEALLDSGASPNSSDDGSLFREVSNPEKGHDPDTELGAMRVLLYRGADPAQWSDPGPRFPANRIDANVDALMKEAKTILNSHGCPPAPTSHELEVCLPNMLRQVNADLSERYRTMLKSSGPPAPQLQLEQSAWIRERDQRCGLRELPGVSQNGWMAYVLGSPPKAACTIEAMRERVSRLGIREQ